jgi:ribosomal protein S10
VNSSNNKTLRIKCFSFDAPLLDNFCKQIGSILRGSVDSVALSALPAKRELINVNRSGFIYTSSKKQFHQVRHARCFTLKCSDVSVLQKKLSTVKLPFGIHLEIFFEK